MLKVLIIFKFYILCLMVNAEDFYDFNFQSIQGNEIRLENYKNKVVLVVNTASMCGFTKQFDGLQKLYDAYKDEGFTVLGLPSNSFKQEFKSENQVKDFCETKFNITFPMTKIVNVIGEERHPFYAWLKEKYDVKPRWNFHKFIFNKDGKMINAFSSLTKPNSEKIKRIIESELKS